MKNLNTLIRICKLQLDDRRRMLAEIQKRRDDLVLEVLSLEIEVERERQSANDESAILMHAAYAEGVKERRKSLEEKIADVEISLEEITDQVAEKFREFKRYELALEARVKEKESLEARSEQMELDEVGATIHRRAAL